jgi:hypothetical protein
VQAESNASSETPQSTTTAGLKFLDSLKQAKDKTYVLCHVTPHMGSFHAQGLSLTSHSGRPIAVHFLTLPNKVRSPCAPRSEPTDSCVQAEVPDYYEYTKLPIALDTIEVRSLISCVEC